MDNNKIGIAGTIIPLPCFYPSISSVKTNLSPLEYLRILSATNTPSFLISAYDIFNCKPKESEEIKALLRSASENHSTILLDCGNYEKYWHKDDTWNYEKYETILKDYTTHIAFSFDSETPSSLDAIIKNTEKHVLRSQAYLNKTIAPIVHANYDIMPKVISSIADKLNPILIAVPERELGEGVLSRMRTIIEIRKALSSKHSYYPLHLLGTGNPLSILLYSLCGADSFDGLEWCQTVVDHNTAMLFHFQQREFLGDQTIYCKMVDFPYSQATIAHNLLFYKKWTSMIHEHKKNGNTAVLIEKYVPKEFIKLIKNNLPEVFNA
jgi:hypothetical protein